MRKLIFSLVVYASLFGFSLSAQAAEIACTNGKVVVGSGSSAVEYPCLRVNLLSRMTIAELGGTSKNDSVSDIWGWVDDLGDADPGNDRSYAIVGLYCSTAFVEVTDPENPTLVATLPDATELDGTRECTEAASSPKPSGLQKHDEEKKEGAVWRDIKVINNHAFIVSDHADIVNNEPGPGLQVFDLTQLRTPPTDGQFDLADQDSYGTYNAHNVFAYTGAGGNDFAVVVGATEGNTGLSGSICSGSGAGGPLFIDVTNPQTPAWAGRFCGDGYTHDIQCVAYTGPDADYVGSDICIASNEDTLAVLDATNKSSVQLLDKPNYDRSEYVHQGDFDAQQRYFYQNDEFDEDAYGFPTRTMVWDFRDLDNGALATEYLAYVNSIDHNNYVHGDYLFQSNYTSGLRVLDIHARETPYQKAYFDTHPVDDNPVFEGSWSNYRFPSGDIAVSDINGGLFMLRPTYESFADKSDLVVGVTSSKSSTYYETPFDVSVTLTNQGPDSTGMIFATVRLSSGGTFDSTSESSNQCKIVSKQLMECRVTQMASGEARTFTARAAAFSDDAIAILAMASTDAIDANGKNNTASTTVTLQSQGGMSDGGGSVAWIFLGALLILLFCKPGRVSRFWHS